MKLKMRILIVMGSLMLLVFALNLGVASAHGGADFSEAPALIPVSGGHQAVGIPASDGAASNAEARNPNCGAHANGDDHPPGP